MGWPVFLLLLLFAVPAGAAEPFALDEGIVVDQDSETVYLMTPARELEAVNGRKGGVVWTATAAAYPLMAHGDILLALDPGKALVVLDRRTGRETKRCTPKGVNLELTRAWDASSEVSALHHDGATYVLWDAGKNGKGAARLDLKTCHAQRLKRAAVDQLVKAARPARSDKPGQAGPYELDGATVELVTKTVGTMAVLTLHRTTANGTKSHKELGRGRLQVPFNVSGDGRLLVVNEPLEQQTKSGEFQVRVSLWNIERAHRLGHFVTTEYFNRYAYIGGRLIAKGTPDYRVIAGKTVSRGHRVRAIDLRDGHEAWARPLNSLKPAGNPPPTAKR